MHRTLSSRMVCSNAPPFHFRVLSRGWGAIGRSAHNTRITTSTWQTTEDEDRVKKPGPERPSRLCPTEAPSAGGQRRHRADLCAVPTGEEQPSCLPDCTDRPRGGDDGVSGFPGGGEVGGWREGRWTEVIAGCPPQGAGLQLLT